MFGTGGEGDGEGQHPFGIVIHGVIVSATKRETAAIELGEQGPQQRFGRPSAIVHGTKPRPEVAQRGQRVGGVSGLAMMRPEANCSTPGKGNSANLRASDVMLSSPTVCGRGCIACLLQGLSSARPVFKATDPTWPVRPQLRHCLQGRLVGCRPLWAFSPAVSSCIRNFFRPHPDLPPRRPHSSSAPPCHPEAQ